ncbi:hypothetical protein Aperf_G00000005252 [Anoplocephala perfoliata]
MSLPKLLSASSFLNPVFRTRLPEDAFDSLPSMVFEPSLVAPWTRNCSGNAIEIPICIGALLLCLRDLHELELKEDRSFLDDFSWSNPYDPPNLQKEADELAEWLLNEATTYSTCREYLLSKSPRLLFEALLGILERTEMPIYPLSKKTCKILSKLSLLEPTHPYLMYIVDVLFDKASAFCSESRQQPDDGKDGLSDIVQFIQQTYTFKGISRQDKLKLINLLNLRLFHDLHMVTENRTRNVIRVIMRGMMFLVRRYVNVVCAKSRIARRETWLINNIKMRPHIHEYAIVAIAKRLGPLMFRFPRFTCLQYELAIRTMVNILCSNTDRLWMPGQTPSSIKIKTDSTTCHQDCICRHDI